MTPTLETPRLWLRPLELGDAPQVQALFPHWEIVRYLSALVSWPYPPAGRSRRPTRHRELRNPPPRLRPHPRGPAFRIRGLRADCKPRQDPFRCRPTVNAGLRATNEKAPRLLGNRGAGSWSGRQDLNL